MGPIQNKLKRKIYLALCVLIPVLSNAQPNPDGSWVKWMDIETAWKQYQENPKPILVDFYTDWCGWCKHMMKTTYAQQDLAAYINANYYPVKFNAEGKDTITWMGKTYKPTSSENRKPHPWAVEMLQGNLSYPTSIFLNGFSAKDSSFGLNLIAPGYLDRQNIEPLLVFTLENVFRNSNYEDFSKEFRTAFNDSLMALRKNTGKWLSPKEIFVNDPTPSKKTLMLITTPWCNSGRVMQKTSFSDPAIAGYIDSTYRLVEFNPEITDSLFYQKELFQNPQSPTPFHQLALYLTRNNLVIPTLVILDENLMPLDIIPFYLPPTAVGLISKFYGSGYNKKMTWQEFLQKGL